MVVKGEEEENRLYNKVREAEYARQKQEQSVKRLQGKSQATKNKHSQEMKRQLSEFIKIEKENDQKVQREQATLDRVNDYWIFFLPLSVSWLRLSLVACKLMYIPPNT